MATSTTKKAASKPAVSTKAVGAKQKRDVPTTGDRAAAFSLPGSDGENHALQDHRGQYVVLYFYPKDNTPGCTLEAQDFRALSKAFAKKNAVVYGVSKDSIESHCKFRDKFDLNFVLLSDADCAVMKQYGAFGEKKLYGKTSLGTIRSTFLIGPDGNIVQSWSPVRVADHAQNVLNAIP